MRSVRSLIVLLPVLPFLLSSCLDPGSSESQFDKEQKAIDNYLKTASFAHVTSDYNNTGVRVGITQFGTGAPPHAGQTINATFIGHLLSDWTVFETTTYTGRVDDISGLGLAYGVKLLPEGSTGTIFITSNNAFGPIATSNVPANSTIAYEVVLNNVTKTSLELAQFKTDTTVIHKYLKDSSITATYHPSGIWYNIGTAGTGKSPDPYDLVTFHYKGSLLPSEVLFQEGDIATQSVYNFIDGLKIGFPLLKTGDVATFYIPSGLGYGAAGSNTIPSNANLIFEITLKEVE